MSEVTKLEQKELQDILELRDSIFSTLNEIGQLSVHVGLLKEEITSTNLEIDSKVEFYKSLLLREREITAYITEKYGEVYLDIESGIITPKE